MNPLVTPFFHTQSNTYTYVVCDPHSRAAAVIDPCLDFDARSGRTGMRSAQQVLDYLSSEQLTLDWILETHAHADHLSAARWLKSQRPGATLAIGAGIREVQKTFGKIFALGADFAVDGSQFDRLFGDGQRFSVGALEAEVIATPGHTDDSVSYRIGDALFVGDSLFMPDGGTARCDFPGGSAARLYRSIQRLFALPDSMRVFVCHDYGPNGRAVACETTIGAQKDANIHVRQGISEADFVGVREARDAMLDMPTLMLPAIQVNIRAGALPEPDTNGVRYLKIPLDQF
jgi:glyoxylase-like metal-dependent hydrolase (beta-lactamase superfamily II)